MKLVEIIYLFKNHIATTKFFLAYKQPLVGITTLAVDFSFCLHVHTYVLSHNYFWTKTLPENCRLDTKMHVVLCSVLRSGFYNWHDMIWVQKNLEVIA